MYIGLATGGVWKTINNGTTWTAIFDRYPVSSIGDIAIAPSNSDVVYVGTGEANNRQSSSFGAGVYKSTDAGRSFEYVGLKETQTIARIVVSPKDPNVVYVAAPGHLFGPNTDRGLYKSTDGGKTWTNSRFVDENTGFTDVVIDPSNPNILLAASYQRRRTPWGFNGGGPGSGLWRTADAGKTWTRLTGHGLPANPMIGRIGLDIARSRPVDDLRVDRGRSERRDRRRSQRRRHVAPARAAGTRWTRAARCPHPIRRRAGSGDRTMAGRRGDSCRTRAIGGCITARCASIRPIPRSRIRAERRSSRRSMAARRGSRSRAFRTATITPSGSIRATGNTW